MTQAEALEILKTGANCFLTGEPGSGKSHTINAYIAYLREHGIDPAVTASTGIAATHIGGVTIHSWSGIGVRDDMDAWALDALMQKEKFVKKVRDTQVLIIDEISMLSGRMLAMVELVCRTMRGVDEAFGGIQVVVVGDFFQLPPIERSSERNPSSFEYEYEAEEKVDRTPFAFSDPVWKKLNPFVLYLNEQHRTEDAVFLDLLLSMRKGTFTEKHKQHLRTRYAKSSESDATQLFTHNADVDRLNDEALNKLPGKEVVYAMNETGRASYVEGLKRGCLSPEQLRLKQGARVMFTKNDPKGDYVNGTLGEVIFCESYQNPKVKVNDGRIIEVSPVEWKLEDESKVKAKIEQYPLRLAWAITVHKSQGMSLDAAHMDLSRVFEYGQGYVALSRLRTLSGLSIAGFSAKAHAVHPSVSAVDARFHEKSEGVRAAFSAMDSKDLKKMQERFLIASGGKLSPVKITEQGLTSLKKGKKGAPHTDEESEYMKKLNELRKKFPNAYRPWAMQDDVLLKTLFKKNTKMKEMTDRLGRQKGSIHARLVKLGLVEDDGSGGEIANIE